MSKSNLFPLVLRQRPNCPPRRAGKSSDELAPPHHSITSSARASSVGGTDSVSILVVSALMTTRRLHDRQVRRLRLLRPRCEIGDARFTEMGFSRKELNIGQLCRERFGNTAALIGFGTDTGTVAAASEWDGPMEVKRVRPSRQDSYQRACSGSSIAR